MRVDSHETLPLVAVIIHLFFTILALRHPRRDSAPRDPALPHQPRPTRARAIDGTIAYETTRDRCLLMRLRLSANMNHGWITMSGLNKYQDRATSHNNHNSGLDRDATPARCPAISDFSSLSLPRPRANGFREGFRGEVVSTMTLTTTLTSAHDASSNRILRLPPMDTPFRPGGIKPAMIHRSPYRQRE